MYSSGFIQERNWQAWSTWTTPESHPDHLLFSVTPMNQALLGVGVGASDLCPDLCALSPCSEDEGDTFLPVGSNLWESMKIPFYLGENLEDLFSIDTNYDSSIPKNKNVLCPPKSLSQELFNFTQGECLRAKEAIYPEHLEELKTVVCYFPIMNFLPMSTYIDNYLLQIQKQLEKGKRVNDSYVGVDMNLLPE